MKCVELKGIKELVPSTINEPKIDGNNVIIEVSKAGICGSDIHNWELGAPVGLVLGHEFSGVVVDPGSRSDLKKGDRVTALPISPCDKCPACLSGNHQYCPETWSKAVGLSLTNPGGYAEITSVRPDLVIKVPDNINDDEVAMIEPAAVSLHAVDLADIEIGDSVLVIGAGIIGDLAAMFAKLNGASYVTISETNAKRGEKAVKLGCADEWFDAKDPNFVANARKKVPFGYDIVIDCCGNSPAVTSALMCSKPNGKVILVGVSMEPITIPSVMAVMEEINIKGSIGYKKKDFDDVIGLLSSKKINLNKFVDDVVGLNDVQKSFERLTSGDDDAIKILIDPKK